MASEKETHKMITLREEYDQQIKTLKLENQVRVLELEKLVSSQETVIQKLKHDAAMTKVRIEKDQKQHILIQSEHDKERSKQECENRNTIGNLLRENESLRQAMKMMQLNFEMRWKDTSYKMMEENQFKVTLQNENQHLKDQLAMIRLKTQVTEKKEASCQTEEKIYAETSDFVIENQNLRAEDDISDTYASQDFLDSYSIQSLETETSGEMKSVNTQEDQKRSEIDEENHKSKEESDRIEKGKDKLAKRKTVSEGYEMNEIHNEDTTPQASQNPLQLEYETESKLLPKQNVTELIAHGVEKFLRNTTKQTGPDTNSNYEQWYEQVSKAMKHKAIYTTRKSFLIRKDIKQKPRVIYFTSKEQSFIYGGASNEFVVNVNPKTEAPCWESVRQIMLLHPKIQNSSLELEEFERKDNFDKWWVISVTKDFYVGESMSAIIYVESK